MSAPISDKFKDCLAIVVSRSAALETSLEKSFGAVGRGLNEKTDSCVAHLPDSLVKRIRFIASVRNRTVHQSGFAVPIDAFVQACDVADRELSAAASRFKAVPSSAIRPTCAPTPSTPRLASRVKRLPRVVSYPLVFGSILWLANWVLTELENPTSPTHAAWTNTTTSVPAEIPMHIAPATPAAASDIAAISSATKTTETSPPPYIAPWSTKHPAAAKARFDWRTPQAAYDASHVNLTEQLPTETFWMLDKTEFGMRTFKEIRQASSRAIQASILLGGNSGLRARLQVLMERPPHGNEQWRVYQEKGLLIFANGDEVPMKGLSFFSNSDGVTLEYIPISKVFSCDRSDENGCLNWVLNPSVTAVALSKRGFEYAFHTN